MTSFISSLDNSATSLSGTRISEKSLLVVGATGTLGRQIVRLAIDEGYKVTCIVRPREVPADFLRDWGAAVINADLKDPTSLPATLIGIHTVIDAATARPEESVQKIDWEGKVALIKAAHALGINKYIFFSIFDCEKYPSIPLMEIKACTESFIKSTGIKFTIFRLCGLMQAIIGGYAIPILEQKSIWDTNEKKKIAYMDSRDIARLTLAAIRRSETNDHILSIAGPKAWSTTEVIELCENYSGGSKAKVIKVPTWILNLTRNVLYSFDWSRDAADRLAFTDTMLGEPTTLASMDETYKVTGLDPSETLSLEQYLKEYYDNIIRKLKEVGAQSRQTDFFV
jgi:uncharacterized protein YbjT (DUF2867 family)